MKINKIRFKNIRSLKGEYEIDFNNGTLANSDLYAITGSTGAGKSTILDVITVALYERVPRVQNASSTMDDMLTRGEKKGYCEVEFQVKERNYLAHWSIRKPKKNFYYDKKLQDLDSGKVLTDKKRESIDKIVEITGLDYERFTRSVLLSQGDFAAFIKAKENDRAELLEKITGTDIYSDISIAAYEKEKLEREKLEKIRNKSEVIETLTDEEVTEIQNKISSHEIEKIKTSQLKDNFLKKMTWLEKIEEIKTKLKNKNEELLQLKTQKEKLKNKFLQLENHKAALPFQSDIEKLDEIQNKIENQNNILLNLKEKEQQRSKELSKTSSDFEKISVKKQELESNYEEKLNLFSQISQLDEKITEIKNNLKEKNQKLTNLKNELKTYKRKFQNTEKEITLREDNLDKLNLWLETNSSLGNFEKEFKLIKLKISEFYNLSEDLEKTKKLLSNQQQEYNSLKEKEKSSSQKINSSKVLQEKIESVIAELKNMKSEKFNNEPIEKLIEEKNSLEAKGFKLKNLIEKAQEYKNKAQELSEFDNELTIKKKSIQNLNEQLKTNSTKLQTLEEKQKLLQKNRDLELKVNNLLDERKKLQADEPCPLCGSTEHPFVQNNYHPKINETESNISSTEKEIKKITTLKNKTQNEKTANQTKIENLESQIKKYKVELQKIEKVFQPEEYKIKDLELMENIRISLRKKFLVLKNNIIKLKDINQKLEINKKELEQEKEKSNQLKTENLKLNNSIKNIKEKINEIENKHSELLDQSNSYKKEIGKYEEEFKFRKPTKREFPKFIKKWENKFSEKEVKKNSVEKLKKKIIKLENEKTQLNYSSKSIDNQMKELKNEINILSDRHNDFIKKRKDKFAEKNPDEEKEKLISRKKEISANFHELEIKKNKIHSLLEKIQTEISLLTKDLNSKKTSLKELKNDLTKKLRITVFKNREDVKNSLLSLEKVNEINSLKSEIENQLISIKSLKIDLENNLKSLKKKNLTQKSKNEINEIIKNLTKDIDKQSTKLAELKQELKTNQEKLYQLKEFNSKLELQRKEHNRWEKLSNLIGSAKGDKFRKFAQSLTLKQLIHNANLQLQQLSNRYLILKDSGLELKILDKYMANSERALSTLSGGESFLISLSLALGLSDLAGKNTTIDSLFIDEGFGTLDSETLDLALSALENLQISGKKIGIISHVGLLKERITTQIKLEKKSGGFSTMMITN